MTDSLYAQAAGAFLATTNFSRTRHVMACRIKRQSTLPCLLPFDARIIVGSLFELFFVVGIVYIPTFHQLLTTSPTAVRWWPLIPVAPVVAYVIEDARNWLGSALSRAVFGRRQKCHGYTLN